MGNARRQLGGMLVIGSIGLLLSGCADRAGDQEAEVDTGPITCDEEAAYQDNVLAKYADALEHLAGYTSLEGDLTVWNCNDCINLDELLCLTEITGDLWIYFSSLGSLGGLDALGTIGGELLIDGNESLDDLDGLSGVTSLGGGLTVGTEGGGNDSITHLDGLSGITGAIHGDLTICHNKVLGDISGLSGIGGVVEGDLEICYHQALEDASGLGGITSVQGDLRIRNNGVLADLDFLSNFNGPLSGSLEIIHCDSITDLSGLSGITSVGGDLEIKYNESLPDCEVCELLDQLDSEPELIEVYGNLEDFCTPVPANCP